jgi:site-specific DNA recombinase
MRSACAYIRVSTDMQKEYSPSSQLRLIKEYAKKNSLNLNELYIYRDEGISGRNAENRPAFTQMLTDAKLNLFEVILIYNTSRFARNHEESIIIEQCLSEIILKL